MTGTTQKKVQVIFVGVGGATCSGKTTLAKHLKGILPDSVIIHQDDFAPPQELVPLHPVHQVQDWDAPAGAISWDRLITFLRHVKETGEVPQDHRSHDHLNEQKEITVPDKVRECWIAEFQRLKEEREAQENGTRLVWALVDGFLLYWHKDVIAELDVRIMLRVPHDILRQRRHERHGYHTAVQSDPVEGSLWRDPPHYWEQIVYPAYVEAHKEVFVDGDVEHGAPTNKVEGLIPLETLEMTMGEAVDRCCRVLKETALNRSQ
ncbi:P-loop containing nucleoside triphosphate hydrolase protein [Macrolepiota fuliginosa MF-IS2]|uniref:P-loop containing nucleoside triphosphate hydrolase protein n=1 Tax=Macrolepiota fuliginosa MF-IS2 TaxID=1400762 RepID=A0A9P5XN99_9AGAR|nr:P-loop containing nucleoside triphosphate hydrolase protein [Macrolepiota fuliginosa MF-IS2]